MQKFQVITKLGVSQIKTWMPERRKTLTQSEDAPSNYIHYSDHRHSSPTNQGQQLGTTPGNHTFRGAASNLARGQWGAAGKREKLCNPSQMWHSSWYEFQAKQSSNIRCVSVLECMCPWPSPGNVAERTLRGRLDWLTSATTFLPVWRFCSLWWEQNSIYFTQQWVRPFHFLPGKESFQEWRAFANQDPKRGDEPLCS